MDELRHELGLREVTITLTRAQFNLLRRLIYEPIQAYVRARREHPDGQIPQVGGPNVDGPNTSPMIPVEDMVGLLQRLATGDVTRHTLQGFFEDMIEETGRIQIEVAVLLLTET